MHPAYSVIFFTTATGAGYGLLTLLGLSAAFGVLPPDRAFALTSLALGFTLIIGGLLSSTFHLGHPERAWRALSQWRSSWLSREGVAAIATFAPTGLFAYGWAVQSETVAALAGLVGAAACALTVYCTSMIYASLGAIRAWTNRWVPPVYLALSLAGGSLLANALAHGFGVAMELDGIVLAALVLAAALKAAYWREIDRDLGGSTAETATGLGHLGAVRLLDAPHTGRNYLLDEMGYRVARTHAVKLRKLAVAAGIAAPFALTVLAMLSGGLIATTAAILAALSAAAGLLVERWLFFAEAKHTVTLYYGDSHTH